METRNIIVNAHHEEIIQYPIPGWPHSFEKTVLHETVLGAIPLHWHDELQWMMVTEGTVELLIYGEPVLLSKGTGAFINAGVVHEIREKEATAALICWNAATDWVDRHVKDTFLKPLTEEQLFPFAVLQPGNDDHKRIINIVMESFQLFANRETGFELQVNSRFFECVYETARLVNVPHSKQARVYDERVKQLLYRIHSDYEANLTLQELADSVYLSKAETDRLFKKHVGKSPFTYLIDYRLERSAELLANTTSSVTEIALAAGFSAASYFIRKFKQKYGMTPLKFRSENRSG